ncbi:hypothetical protein [Lysobacter terrae]
MLRRLLDASRACIFVDCEMPFFMWFGKSIGIAMLLPVRAWRASASALAAAGKRMPGTAPEKKLGRIVDIAKNRD